MNKLAAFGFVAALAGLGACGSDNNSSSNTTAASVTIPLATNANTSVSDSSVTTANTSSESTVPDSTTGSTETTDLGTATGGSTDSTSVDISTRMDEARAALQDGDFTTMLQALDLSGLSSEIQSREVTILAPTDKAFSDLSTGTIGDLLTNPTKVKDLLKRHIIDELLTFDQLKAKSSVKTMSGDTLTVTNEGGVVKIDGATVTELNKSVTADNGQDIAVFSIDRVLLSS